MDNIRILVANEPRCYREVIAAAVHELRPHAEVITVEPADLDREVVHREPHLVLCSRLTEVVETRTLAWVLLYPDGEARAVISIAGQRRTVPDIAFCSLLSIVDQTEQLA